MSRESLHHAYDSLAYLGRRARAQLPFTVYALLTLAVMAWMAGILLFILTH